MVTSRMNTKLNSLFHIEEFSIYNANRQQQSERNGVVGHEVREKIQDY